MNNYEGWHHIGTAPKDRDILVWNGYRRHVAHWEEDYGSWMTHDYMTLFDVTHWRGCPPPPPISLPDDEE